MPGWRLRWHAGAYAWLGVLMRRLLMSTLEPPYGERDRRGMTARIEGIREEGGDPFGSYQIPRAALALKQGFGRLIRSRKDRGVVAILDGRIVRKNYGATLLASLPERCPRTFHLDDVRGFFA